MRALRRFVPVVAIAGLFLSAAPARPAVPTEASWAGEAARWNLRQADYVEAGQQYDVATAQDYRQKIVRAIPRLLSQLATAIGPQRAVLQESLDLHRKQLVILAQLTSSQEAKVTLVKADQQRLLERIDGVEKRMSQLEQEGGEVEAYVSKLDARADQLEGAMIRECLDLRHAPVRGADEYRVKQTPGSWTEDHFESDNLTLDVHLMLNSCRGNLTQRGLLIQLAMATRDLVHDMSLYATFKGLKSGGRMGVLSRQELPLWRPGYMVDGQVVELFFPYDEIPDFSSPDRIALTLAVTHDGSVIYSLPDRFISCVLGQRINCRWALTSAQSSQLAQPSDGLQPAFVASIVTSTESSQKKFVTRRNNLPLESGGSSYPAPAVEVLLRNTEADLNDALKQPDAIPLRDYVAATFRRERAGLEPQRQADGLRRSPPPLYSYALARLDHKSLDKVAVDAALDRIGALIQKIISRSKNHDLTVNLCVMSRPTEGVRFAMYAPSLPNKVYETQTNGEVVNAFRGLYAYRMGSIRCDPKPAGGAWAGCTPIDLWDDPPVLDCDLERGACRHRKLQKGDCSWSED